MGRIVGIDIGGTRVRASIKGSGTLRTAPTPAALDALPGVIAGLVDGADAIGVGCAGLVDHASGVVRWMPHADGRDLALGETLEERFGVPVWVDNDANAATLGEARTGVGAGHRMVLGVMVGTGIGAGLVIEGRVERGRGHLGEVGHMRIAEHGDCRCGRVGCWEEHASGRALDRLAAALDPGADGAWLVARAAGGDAVAIGAVDSVARSLAVGIADLVFALDPDVVVLGGIVPTVGAALLEPVRSHLAATGGGIGIAGPPPVRLAAHGDRAGLEGAMIGAMEVLG
jgi:glucokinase